MRPHQPVGPHLLTAAAFDASHAFARKAPRVAGVCGCWCRRRALRRAPRRAFAIRVGLSFGGEIALQSGDWGESTRAWLTAPSKSVQLLYGALRL